MAEISEAALLQARLIGADPAEVQKALDNWDEFMRQAAQSKFRTFVKDAWPHIEPMPFVGGWHIDAIADHLEAVSRGHIKRLLVNVPPRSSKSTLASVMWPAWTWAQNYDGVHRLMGPHVRFVVACYAQTLGLKLSTTTRRLLESEWYRRKFRGPGNFSIADDQDNKLQFDTTRGGSRLVTSTDTGITGLGGDIIVVDDPHSTQGVLSDKDRTTVIDTWWRQTIQSRINDPKSGAFAIIMQRLHEEDLSGYVLDNSDAEWTHLMLPMMYEKARHCVTVKLPDEDVVWQDPRTYEGELLAPDRFDQKWIDTQARDVGPYVFSGQYQQRPTPAGGAIFKSDWWQDWNYPKYPIFDLLIAGVDTAYTEKEENDYSALTIWGVWQDDNGLPQLMLVYAWRDRLQMNDLVMRVAKTCKKPMYPVDRVLIEAKANGLSVAQELQRLFGSEDFAVETVDPKGDKVARAMSVQSLFAPSKRHIKRADNTFDEIETPGIIWAPTNRAWADMVKNEAASFPKGRNDDCVDSMVTALQWLRKSGIAKRREERIQELVDSTRYEPAAAPLYDV